LKNCKDQTQYKLICDDLVVQCGQSCLLLFGGKHNFWIGAHANLTDNSYTYFNPTGPAEYDMLKIADVEVYAKRVDELREKLYDLNIGELEPIAEVGTCCNALCFPVIIIYVCSTMPIHSIYYKRSF
jgi:hypothetical protein